jgi:hypothetical protein
MRARSGWFGWVESCGDNAFVIAGPAEHFPPGSGDHAVAVARYAGERVASALIGRRDESLVFDGPGPDHVMDQLADVFCPKDMLDTKK